MVSADMTSPDVLHPPVTWAQRNDLIFLTILVEDVKNPEIKVEGSKLHFKGQGGPDKKIYEVDIDLYKDINPETSKQLVSGRGVDFVLMKAEAGPYWPRLLKDTKKCHWLKVDFNRWKDEDDSDDEAGAGGPGGENMDIEAMMKQMGGLGGMGGMGGMPGMEGADDKAGPGPDEPEEDSDDGDLPDLED